MRLYIVLILTALAMAFGTGYFALFLQGSYTPTLEDIVQINELKLDFQKKVAPRAIINFNSIYYSPQQIRLIDPFYSTPSEEINKQIDYFSSQDCFKDFEILVNQPGFEKVWVWEEYRCGKKDHLSPGFFRQPPFIHPSGHSYAYLSFKLNKENNRSRAWVRNNLRYFHITELVDLQSEVGNLGGIYDLLVKLDYNSLLSLAKGEGTILTKTFLLARITYPGILPILEYRFYDRDDLDNFLKDSSFILQNYKQGRPCFYRDGELCWDYDVKHIFKLANFSTIAFFFGLIIICAIVVRLLLVKIRIQRQEEERKRLALQVLTHEFRTPVTSLLLSVEQINRYLPNLEDDLQEILLRMNSEIYRLQRLTEKSRNYLKVQEGGKLIQLNDELVPSVYQMIDEMIYPYSDEHGDLFKVTFKGEDRSIKIDLYWLQICLKNLIENAFFHGTPPVEFTLEVLSDSIVVYVSDQGKCQFDTLEELTSEFVKGNKSSGTGLGMSIVHKIIREMEGKIVFNNDPTSFKITFNR
ncbi:PF11884 domain protein [Bacteriovorax sp. BSW11_IV]|uniref:sensor histidine kinase n=1 Tax=Bacteriovorax sp. BSW11_IV TaxID=1353529 RepID=UPI00038A2F0D|nr:HAMP domain-containing sensor histidine kinase [Bacteriovorax sp. BSW11_IV]EQC48969.1 PF11884 domain protein [Bacteriovorax sp. BSW11_IV]